MSTCCKDTQSDNAGCCSNATTAETGAAASGHQGGEYCCRNEAS